MGMELEFGRLRRFYRMIELQRRRRNMIYIYIKGKEDGKNCLEYLTMEHNHDNRWLR